MILSTLELLRKDSAGYADGGAKEYVGAGEGRLIEAKAEGVGKVDDSPDPNVGGR